MEKEREYLKTERTGDSVGFHWVDADTKEPVIFTY